MTVDLSALQLPLEQALVLFLSTADDFTDLRFVSAHSAENLSDDPSANGDMIVVRAGLPNDELISAGVAVVDVEFSAATSIADADTRSAQTAAHCDRVSALLNLFSTDNFTWTLAALNAQSSALIGFSGWEANPRGAEDDGRDETRLIARLRYTFELFLI